MPGKYVEEPFIVLLTDAILLCELAESLPHLAVSRHSALVRASIMSSIFSVEAAANSLMTPAIFPKRLLDYIDKATPIDKFEFVLYAVQPSKNLDRGSKHLQQAAELFEIRNRYVHPRTRSRSINFKQLDENRVSIEKTDEKSKHLQIPASPEDWGAEDARRILKATSDFLDHFALELCELKVEEIFGTIFSRVDIEGNVKFVFTAEHREAIVRARKRWKIAFSFLGDIPKLITGVSGDEPSFLRLLFKYSWGRGGLQVHEQRKVIEVEVIEVSHIALTQATQHFLLWFQESESEARGRNLIGFEVYSEDGSYRYAEYSILIPNSGEPPKEEPRYRPIGRVSGVEVQAFVNGIYGAEQAPNGSYTVLFKNERGEADKLEIPAQEVAPLRELIWINRRSDWQPAALLSGEKPSADQDVDRNFSIEEAEFAAFDAMSGTAFLVYKASSGKRVQINMNPGQLLTIFNLLGADAQP